MKIAVMQPYFCPHIGYFQLVNAVDIFVFYDDVQYIKRGYINRNTLSNNIRFTVPVSNASTKNKINEVNINWENIFFDKFQKTLQTVYGKLKNFNNINSMVELLFKDKPRSISELAINSIKTFSRYLDIQTKFLKSSEIDYDKLDNKALNLINICKSQNCNHYINSIGGKNLYKKDFFYDNDIKLNFLKGQVGNSIIDQAMHDQREDIINIIDNNYELV